MATDAAHECATLLLDTFHLVRRTIGTEMHKRSCPELSMQQFRAMRTIERKDGASLSEVSERMGATISAASKLIEGLVERSYVRRETDPDDRRRMTLALTDKGKEVLASVHLEAISCLADKLTTLSPSENAVLRLSMELLRTTLASAEATAQE